MGAIDATTVRRGKALQVEIKTGFQTALGIFQDLYSIDAVV